MSSFADPAGKRIADKQAIKMRIHYSMDCVMQKPVADVRLMDNSRLGIGNFKFLIAAMAVIASGQIVMEGNNVICKIKSKFLDIKLFALVA